MDAKVIMLASGKGGTGKSSVSVLLGARLAARGLRVLLVELDSGLRSVDIISGVYGKTVYDVEDVLSGRCEGSKAVVESPLYPGLFVVSAPYSGGEVKTAALQVFVQKMRTFFDMILVDTAAGMGAPFVAATAACNMAVLVLTPDPVTLRDGRIVCDAILAAGRSDVRLLLNKVPPALDHYGIADLDEAIDTVCAQLIGVVPYSEDIITASATGEILPRRTKAHRALCAIAARLCGEYVPLVIT